MMTLVVRFSYYNLCVMTMTRHACESRHPRFEANWTPAFAGVTTGKKEKNTKPINSTSTDFELYIRIFQFRELFNKFIS